MNTTRSRWPRWTLLAAVPGMLMTASCRQRDVCEEVDGPCLALRVTGTTESGLYDELRTTLQLDATAPLRTGSTTGDIQLPLTLRVVPPPGVLPSAVHGVGVTGLRSDTQIASAQTAADFTWADDEHKTITLELLPPDGTDGGLPPSMDLARPPSDGPPADLALPPLPSLKWTVENNPGGRNELYEVWTSSGTQAWAVGAGGTVLAHQPSGAWTAETSGTTAPLYGLSGLPGSSLWASGQNPGVWRRDSGSGKWVADQQGLMLTPETTLWAVAGGATAGELWAGSEDGKVWHRQGSPTANGAWQLEQALPTGVTVNGIAYADGAVYAVGQRGYVAVRKDSGTGARWQTAVQYPALAGMTMGHADGLYGVFAFDRNTAVAVGSKGLLIRYSGGTWQTMPQTIDGGANEFNAIWGTTAGRLWAVGYNGLIVRIEGATATQLRTDGLQSLYSIFGRSESDIYAVGSGLAGASLILHGQP